MRVVAVHTAADLILKALRENGPLRESVLEMHVRLNAGELMFPIAGLKRRGEIVVTKIDGENVYSLPQKA